MIWSARTCLRAAVVLSTFCPALCRGLEPPPLTDLDDFFVFHSGAIPPIDESWRLDVEGAVATPLSLDIQDLGRLRTVTEMATLECAIPGGPVLLVGNAVWKGVPLRAVIEKAGPLQSAKSVRFYAADDYALGDFDLAEILANNRILLADEMNGQTLPLDQGYPLRLVVPGAGGYNWLQWVTRIEILTDQPVAEFDYLPQHARIL